MPHIRLSATEHKQLPGQTRGDYWKSKVKRRPCNQRRKILVKRKTYSKRIRIQNYQSTSISKVGINYKPQDQGVLSGNPIDIKIEVKLITKTHTTNWRQCEFEFKFSLVYSISISLSKKNKTKTRKTLLTREMFWVTSLQEAGDALNVFHGYVSSTFFMVSLQGLNKLASTFIGIIFMTNNFILIMS